MMISAMQNNHDDNLVAIEDACPNCGERSIDCLVWIDDDTVRCATCGCEYEPLAPPKGGDDASEA